MQNNTDTVRRDLQFDLQMLEQKVSTKLTEGFQQVLEMSASLTEGFQQVSTRFKPSCA